MKPIALAVILFCACSPLPTASDSFTDLRNSVNALVETNKTMSRIMHVQSEVIDEETLAIQEMVNTNNPAIGHIYLKHYPKLKLLLRQVQEAK